MRDGRGEARVEEFASALRELKGRTPHSYETLAARLDISRSALHRYCSGKAVPPDFGTVELLARQCGAGRDELTELHRLWTLASEPPSPHPERAPDPESEPEPQPVSGPGDTGAVGYAGDTGDTGEEPNAATAASRPRRGLWIVAAVVVAAVIAATLAWASFGDGKDGAAADDRLLFSAECRDPVHIGQEDECVREVQQLLSDAGATIGIDGIFGPETLRRVEAFQVRAGLAVDGIVGDDTKRALYAGKVSMTTWDEKRVTDRIRKVFAEDPETAVRIARCQSRLDPLYVLPNVDGSRNWGVFQISDARLRDLRGTPAQALDPEWNIRAAHRLWSQKEDFSHWPHCLSAIVGDGEGDKDGREKGAEKDGKGGRDEAEAGQDRGTEAP
ncbi:peptidoglycan-binding protein [Streptomyces sp. TRM 70361]|uniref:peptidoglycan-binding protein n=1 Tax=Streptomyces sp. TRM 70361 TaxID=3116553 RepID=UPI002E7AC280|nr:peptidoglycan-binding protein [Streptomyces sp. TRM 70361]MEE1938832.1 peptidoglycan-binding protein [Streptomyces sp. TRM 70361]